MPSPCRMKLPPELEQLVREYSQPCFKYFREYNLILRLSGLSKWSELKKALRERPANVLPRLLSYEKAQIEWLRVAGRPSTLYDKEYYWFCSYKYTPEQWHTCKLAIRTREWKEFTKVVNL